MTGMTGPASTVPGPQSERGFNGTQGPPGPSGVVKASNAYVVWEDFTPGNGEIFFRAGQGLGTINLSNNTGQSLLPQIAVSGNNNVYVTWEDGDLTNDDIIFAASNNNGRSFGPLINISNNTGDSSNPQIAAIGNNGYITWDKNTPAGNRDIFFAVSNNNGTSFGTPINMSNTARGSSFPQIAAIDSNVYVTWVDATPGNNDIFVITNAKPFATPVNISNNPGNSLILQIATS